jgi:hypothetical protein
MTHYTNTNNPIDFPKKKKIPMLEKFAAQSLVESDGELIFSKEKFAELIVKECAQVCLSQRDPANLNYKPSVKFAEAVKQHFGVEE